MRWFIGSLTPSPGAWMGANCGVDLRDGWCPILSVAVLGCRSVGQPVATDVLVDSGGSTGPGLSPHETSPNYWGFRDIISRQTLEGDVQLFPKRDSYQPLINAVRDSLRVICCICNTGGFNMFKSSKNWFESKRHKTTNQIQPAPARSPKLPTSSAPQLFLQGALVTRCWHCTMAGTCATASSVHNVASIQTYLNYINDIDTDIDIDIGSPFNKSSNSKPQLWKNLAIRHESPPRLPAGDAGPLNSLEPPLPWQLDTCWVWIKPFKIWGWGPQNYMGVSENVVYP